MHLITIFFNRKMEKFELNLESLATHRKQFAWLLSVRSILDVCDARYVKTGLTPENRLLVRISHTEWTMGTIFINFFTPETKQKTTSTKTWAELIVLFDSHFVGKWQLFCISNMTFDKNCCNLLSKNHISLRTTVKPIICR